MNAARFYWDKLEGVNNVFKASEDKTDKGLDYFQNICCELINEFRCPRLVQIEALKLRSKCFPDTYWFAKFQLDQALGLIAKCEVDPVAGERDLAALTEVKQGVEAMLEERKKGYEDDWKAKGRDPPDGDEWYDIVENEVGEEDSAETFENIGEPSEGSDLVLLPLRPRKLGPEQTTQQEDCDEEEDSPTDLPETAFGRRVRERAKAADKAAQESQ